MKAAILGGTKGMGRALARRLLQAGDEVFLLGRNPEDLGRSADDLAARGADGQAGGSHHCDLSNPSTFGPAIAAARAHMGGLDLVVITAAAFDVQDGLEQDTDAAIRLCTLNFAHTVGFCELARKDLLEHGGGTLCVFSSVAGDRGRKPVIIYGASKAGVSAYCEGLDHKFRDQGLVTVCVKPGFVKTSMTDGLTPPPFAGEPEEVAEIVAKAIRKGKPVVYAPSMWALVMMVIKRLPRFVMRRIGF